jgi:flagellar biosynthesis protein
MSERSKEDTRHTAVALHYNGEDAPRVTAKGSGGTAERILELARHHGIPIQHDRLLVELLSQVELGEEIPPALYAAIAELLSFVYSLSGKHPMAPRK